MSADRDWQPLGALSDDGFSVPFDHETIDIPSPPPRTASAPVKRLGITDPFEALALYFFILAASGFVGVVGFAIYLTVTGGWGPR